VNGKEFIRKSARWAKAQGVTHVVFPSRGKGGHKIVQVGSLKTTVKTGEIGPGLLAKMMSDLDIPKGAF
jgi:hypothetical protein